ncbi:hypothetical protein Zmor_004889 [Zophobas morio]|uniref:Uncharacterized protein n=1 Tax=Zophobas morio TaxID=2755281 RepID=A0AA38MJZ2_9CUCU|nr:hypothetical protein Zmor_004889 [Zophobas morio]
MNTGFEEFLQTLQIVQIFTMFASGFFENLKILRTVRDHINNRIIYKDAVLDNNDRKSYGLLLGRIRQLEIFEAEKDGCINNVEIQQKNNLENQFRSFIEHESRIATAHQSSPDASWSSDKAVVNATFSNNSTSNNNSYKTQSTDVDEEEASVVNVSTSTWSKGATEGDESETSDVQRGAGERSDTVNGDHKYFNEKGECEAFIRKFGLTARRMEFSFKDVNDDEIPQNWLKNAFQELLDYITLCLHMLRNTPLRRPSTTPMAVESLLDVRTALMGESSLLTAERRAHKDRSGASRSGVQGSLEAESRWMFVKDLDQRLWV